MDPSADPAPTRVLRRAAAVSRVAGELRFVARPGWNANVHGIGGAARVVWDLLDAPMTLRQVAVAAGVDPDDAFLSDAVDLLTSLDLVIAEPMDGDA